MNADDELLATTARVTAPIFPVRQGDALHGFRGFVEPAAFATGEVALDMSDGFRAAEMDVGGLPTHVVGEAFFVALFRQRLDFDVAAIGCQAANDPMFGEVDVRIPDADGALDQFAAEDRVGPQVLRPDPRGWRELLGLPHGV